MGASRIIAARTRDLPNAYLRSVSEPHELTVRITTPLDHRASRHPARLRNRAKDAVSRVQSPS